MMPSASLTTRTLAIADELERLYPDVRCELDFQTPFQLLVATILSAQCTDKRVNLVTPALFARFPDPATMALAPKAELEALIKSTGFYHNKAKSILGAAQMLVAEFGGVVPQTMSELLRLPGVARKTGNVVLGSGFNLAEGIAVDTHVVRLTALWKLTKHDDPVKVEREICELLPPERWTRVGHQIIWHGRRVCNARSPECVACTLAPLCPSARKPNKPASLVGAPKKTAKKR